MAVPGRAEALVQVFRAILSDPDPEDAVQCHDDQAVTTALLIGWARSGRCYARYWICVVCAIGGQYWGIDLLEENADTTCYGVDVGKRRGRSFLMLY